MADAKKETKAVAKAPAAEQKKEETTGVTRRLAKTAAANNASVAAVAEKEGAKSAEKKTPAKKAPAKKAAAEKKTVAKAEAKAAAKKAPAKKTAAKKETAVKDSAVTANVALQYYGKDTNINEVIENVKKSYVADGHKSTSIKSLNIYLKPEDGFAYFVINESYAGKVDLF
ncbi:MAG: DUF6465 family protein [Lachnospiraceae bacterium]|nr:DUF6465 family protein [Lachnospiraceae bacterium]